jgi:hypothetical protein
MGTWKFTARQYPSFFRALSTNDNKVRRLVTEQLSICGGDTIASYERSRLYQPVEYNGKKTRHLSSKAH